jgi:DNA repair protein RecO (recombination protein O)
MPEPRNYQTEAIVIRKTRLGEADSILTLYTPHLGKIQGFAKSLRKPKSKLAGHLELLTHSRVSLARGKNIDTITGSQTIEGFLTIKGDLWLTSCALYATELLHQFTAEHIENQPLFQLTLDTLHRLGRENDRELVLRYFEMRLLESVGYRPQLRECVACHRALEPVVNYFSPSGGGLLCPGCAPTQTPAYPLSLNAQKVLRRLQSHDYETASQVKIEPALAREMEKATGHYLKYLLEKEVKSAAWLETLRAQMPKPGQPPLP